MTSYADLQGRAFEANRAIVEAGLVILTFGNASAVDRAAGVLAIKPSGVAYDALTAASMVVLDLETGAVVSGEQRPSSDTPTHLELYRRFDGIGAIVHTHSPFAVAWAQAGEPIPCLGTTHADHFDGPVPITRALTVDEIDGDYEAATGAVIADTFETLGRAPGSSPGVLVRSHGPFAWGPDARGAVANAVALEAIAEIAHHTAMLAPAATPIGQALLARHHARKHGASAYYGQP